MRLLLVLVSWCLVSHSYAIEQDISKRYLGKYAKSAKECQSSSFVTLFAKTIKLTNGEFSVQLSGIDHCYSCEGGARYSGKVVWLFPEFGTQSPSRAMFTLNHNEQQGKLGVILKDPVLASSMGFTEAVLLKCL